MKVSDTRTDRYFNIALYTFGALLLFIVLYPIYFVVIASFSNAYDVSNGNVWLVPVRPTLKGYSLILADMKIWIGYRNTIVYTIVGTFISLAATLPAGYALSRKDLVGRNVLSLFFVFTLFFSGGLLPTFFTIRNVGLYNTFWVMVIPFCVSVYNLIITRTFFSSSIPEELLEAAQLDGCNNTRFFFQIALPLSKAVIAVIGLYYAVGNWNQYFNALIYLKNDQLVPLQLVLRDILLKNKAMAETSGVAAAELQMTIDSMKYAVIVVSTIPIMCAYPFIQKHFNQGVMIGAVKG